MLRESEKEREIWRDGILLRAKVERTTRQAHKIVLNMPARKAEGEK